MTSSITILTNTKINLKLDSKKHKQLFLNFKNTNSFSSDIKAFKFLLEHYKSQQLEIKSLKVQNLNLKVINESF
jgi:hypothetical protein